MSSYKDGIRKARKAVIEALDALAAIDAPTPVNEVVNAKHNGREALLVAKANFDYALQEGPKPVATKVA